MINKTNNRRNGEKTISSVLLAEKMKRISEERDKITEREGERRGTPERNEG